MHKLKPTGALLLLLLTITVGRPTHAIDLLDIYEYARSGDPQFKQAEAARRVVREQRPQAIARLLPDLSFSADTVTNEQNNMQEGDFGQQGKVTFNSRGYRLSLTQPAFRWDRLVGLRQAGSRILQAEAELSAARQGLILRTTEAYFNVLAAEDTLAFADAEEKSLGRQLEQVRQRFEVGLTAITDVQEAQAGHDRAVADAITAQNSVDDAREALREITGEYFSDLAGLGKNMPLLRPEPDDIDNWTDTALEQNLSVTAARHAVDTARTEIKRQFAGHLPTLDIVASHGFGKTGGRFGSSESTTSAVGLELNMPVFQGGLVNSKVREARQQLQQQLQGLERTRREAQRDTRQAFLGVLSGISRVLALQQAVVSSETALQATEAGFEVGTRTAVDVVAAERDTFEARRDLARARYDYLLDSMRLKQASGTLAGDDIGHINTWLE
ncbi:MAG: TolC family outer membrane protein [Gammaproteobacteria bacterium]